MVPFRTVNDSKGVHHAEPFELPRGSDCDQFGTKLPALNLGEARLEAPSLSLISIHLL